MKAFLISLACALSLGACGDSPSRPPHIVLVLVDQLRQDAVSKWMPETQAFADRGVTLTHMRSAAPWTYPSVISMFSGLYPQQHGADGQHPDPLDKEKGKQLSTFETGVPLFSRALGDSYHTAAFVTNPFLLNWNPFHTSFEHYVVDPFIGSQGATRGNPDAVWTSDMFADDVNREVMAYYDSRLLTEPEFTYVHYIDVHGPWDGAPFEVGEVDHRVTNDHAYEVAARYTDTEIVKLYHYFQTRYGEDLVFIVTSDHGQELGQDLKIGQDQAARGRKNTPHEFNTRIPFLVFPSKRIAAGTRLDLACSNVDIAPTILELAGLEAPEQLAGRSLLALLQGQQPGPEWTQRPTYTLMNAFGRWNDGTVIGNKKYVRHRDVKDGHIAYRWIYDLSKDPAELILQPGDFSEAEPTIERLAGPGRLHFDKHFGIQDPKLMDDLDALGYGGGAWDKDN